MSARQYEFKEGHFVDTWNEGIDDSSDFDGLIDDESWPEAILEICGCGSPQLIVAAMGDYLTRVETDLSHQVRTEPDLLADYLLAVMAEDLDLAEHGTSIFTSWLTDAGRRWLELWRATMSVGVSDD